ncbi:DoxX family protein [Spirosoma daeguense]
MENQQTSSKAVHIALWVAQVVLAVSLIWAAWMKLVQPVDQLANMWPWAGQVPVALVKFAGIVDLLGALGLVLPAPLRIQPKLTPITAICVIILMVCASVFHILRGEALVIGVNIVFALMAAFIAWGRFRKASIDKAWSSCAGYR